MKLACLLACALLTAACARAPVAAQLACPPVDGVEQVLAAPGVFIGDMHGSQESPAFLAALSCHVLHTGRPLVVAMEYDARDQPVLDRFLTMPDAQQALVLLTSTPHWTGNIDGRASVAMRDALHAMHGYGHGGAKLQLLAYDLWGPSAQERDARSAAHIRQARSGAPPETFWIVYGGNVHARKTRGLPFRNAPPDSQDYEPLGYLIRDWNLVHLDAAYRGGAGWGCRGPSPADCSVRELGPGCSTDCPSHPAILLRATDPAYDGVYDVGTLSVSRPLYLP